MLIKARSAQFRGAHPRSAGGSGETGASRPAKPALAIYCRCPEPGKVKTRLAAQIGDRQALDFYRKCLDLLKRELPILQKWYDLVVCPAEKRDVEWARDKFPVANHVIPQVEGELGMRLQTTQSDINALGYERIVLIGSDAPSLPLDFLLDMNKMLRDFDVALGPAHDGGVWGIGAAKPLPNLHDISWSTSNVYNELTEACHRADLSVGVLPGWYDVDQSGSLQLASDDLIRSTSRERQEFGTWIESLHFRANPRKK